MASLLAAFHLLANAPASAQQGSAVSYPVEEGFGGASVTLKARLYRPAGVSPAAAVIVLHGCSGPIDATYDWARRLAGWGYVAIVPDSFGSRDRSNVCREPLAMPPGARLIDVVGTAEYLATLPFVRPDRIALLGFSHGAGTVLDALQQVLSAVGVRGGIAYYPLCIPEKHAAVAMPLLVVIGERDDWAPAERCRALQQAGLSQPGLVEIVYYAGAHHGFDIDAPALSVSGAAFSTQDGSVGDAVQHRIEYDPVAARDAEARTRAMLETLLR